MEKKILPTAEELATDMFIKHPGQYSSFNRVGFTGKQLRQLAVAFAVLHAREALRSVGVSEDSYPIENIKM